jgi:hypothetical protein
MYDTEKCRVFQGIQDVEIFERYKIRQENGKKL